MQRVASDSLIERDLICKNFNSEISKPVYNSLIFHKTRHHRNLKTWYLFLSGTIEFSEFVNLICISESDVCLELRCFNEI